MHVWYSYPYMYTQVSDVNVICGVVKDFLTHLREPVLTFRLHNTFMAAIGNVSLL